MFNFLIVPLELVNNNAKWHNKGTMWNETAFIRNTYSHPTKCIYIDSHNILYSEFGILFLFATSELLVKSLKVKKKSIHFARQHHHDHAHRLVKSQYHLATPAWPLTFFVEKSMHLTKQHMTMPIDSCQVLLLTCEKSMCLTKQQIDHDHDHVITLLCSGDYFWTSEPIL